MSTNNVVLLLKAPKGDENSDPYGQLLKAEGFEACSVPALSFTFVGLNSLSDALHLDSKYSCLVLTSPRSAEAIQNAVSVSSDWQNVLCPKWASKPTFVVGQTTAVAAKNLGLTPFGADSGNAANLANFIVNELRTMQETERPVLLPCGQLSLETIPTVLENQGIPVHSLTVYETVADPALADNLKAFINTLGRPQFIVFFSPSIVRFSHLILESLEMLSSSVQLIAIGPTTETAMRSVFSRVSATAGRPTPEHVCKAIRELHSAEDIENS